MCLDPIKVGQTGRLRPGCGAGRQNVGSLRRATQTNCLCLQPTGRTKTSGRRHLQCNLLRVVEHSQMSFEELDIVDANRFAEVVANGSDRAIMMALIKLEERGVKASAFKSDVAKLLSHPTTDVRCVAARALIAIGGKPGIPDAMYLLDDKEPRVRAAAAYAMSLAGGKRIAYPVIREMLSSKEQSERKAAESILDFIDADFSADKPCAEELAQTGDAGGGAEFEELKIKDFALKTGDVIEVRMYKTSIPDVEAKHQAALRAIAAIDKRLLARIGKELASLNDEDEDSSEDACSPQQAIIPPHGSEKDVYYFLLGDSDFDIEHGFACLFKNKKDFCFVEYDLASNVSPSTQIETIATLFDDCSGQ